MIYTATSGTLWKSNLVNMVVDEEINHSCVRPSGESYEYLSARCGYLGKRERTFVHNVFHAFRTVAVSIVALNLPLHLL